MPLPCGPDAAQCPDAASPELFLADLSATEALAKDVALRAVRGDLIALWGDLGAGKTAFARGFIHARQEAAGLAREEVPSPTFTLVQLYEMPGGSVWHFDLYRLGNPAEIHELGLDDALAEGITLIEWPERLGPLLPEERLDLSLAAAPDDGRTARLLGRGERGRRLARAPSS